MIREGVFRQTYGTYNCALLEAILDLHACVEPLMAELYEMSVDLPRQTILYIRYIFIRRNVIKTRMTIHDECKLAYDSNAKSTLEPHEGRLLD